MDVGGAAGTVAARWSGHARRCSDRGNAMDVFLLAGDGSGCLCVSIASSSLLNNGKSALPSYATGYVRASSTRKNTVRHNIGRVGNSFVFALFQQAVSSLIRSQSYSSF